jgi:hypothetical protein
MPAPAEFFQTTFVELFNRGVALLEARAAAGGPKETAALEDVRGARGATWLSFEGGGEVWLALEGGAMRAVSGRPDDMPLRLGVAMPNEAAELWMEELRSRAALDSEQAALRTARGASKRFEEVVEGRPLEFHLVVKDTPDFEQVVIRIGVHAMPPEQPKFTATVRWDDLEAMRDAGQSLQQLMMAGKLKLGGDYSRAMQVAMELMQAAQRR